MFFDSFIAIFFGCIFAIMLSEITRFFFRIKRWGHAQMLVISPLLLAMPILSYGVIDSYEGTLSGLGSITPLTGAIYGTGMFLIGWLFSAIANIGDKKRFFCCLFLYLSTATYMVYHSLMVVTRPVIG